MENLSILLITQDFGSREWSTAVDLVTTSPTTRGSYSLGEEGVPMPLSFDPPQTHSLGLGRLLLFH